MKENPTIESPSKSTGTKTIRLTRAEIYAMRIPTPRKKRIAFGLVGLLVMAVLGAVLWRFQDFWLPYWLPESEAETVTAGDGMPAAVTPGPVASSFPGAAAEDPEAPLDFLSAAPWDHPRFLQGVRTFNQALDRYRRYLGDRSQAPLLPQIEEGAAEALRHFESVQAEAPDMVPLAAYMARARRLAAEIELIRQQAIAAAERTPRTPAGEWSADELKRHPDYREGSRLFNQALEQYNRYRADTSQTELLKPVEDLARQAGERFESLKRQAPVSAHPELDRLIHQSYGMMSASRGAQLQAGSLRDPAPARSPAAPARRRPELAPYQPPDGSAP